MGVDGGRGGERDGVASGEDAAAGSLLGSIMGGVVTGAVTFNSFLGLIGRRFPEKGRRRAGALVAL